MNGSRPPVAALVWIAFICLATATGGFSVRADGASVSVREERIVLPTYVAGEPDPNPMFYFGRASQGAQGRVYPYPLYDTLTGHKEDREYRLIYLENEYVRIGVMPDIGGRLFEGIDKSNGYPFIYRQHVIKPALIGLIGAWISGGIEWNIPHHHRATTYLPVQHRVEELPDGGKTVWVGELEIRHRMRWAVGYTLRPGSSRLEARVKILNRTPVAQTMLCFANVAVHANADYQVIFPPRTRIVTHHHKREFTTWPIATTRYGGWDFRPGTDVSWYRNHIGANSMFAWNYDDDFLAGYDHGRHAGLLSVADHHLVPGKKLWTWGNGPRGRMWDRILTDRDGPYIELMVGAYSDNQPDYSWLQPYETKDVSIHWYPFRDIGGVKQATLNAAVNLEVGPDMARVGFCTTARHAKARAQVFVDGRAILDETIEIDPGQPFKKLVLVPAGTRPDQVRAVLSAGDRELVAYAPLPLVPETMPAAVTPPRDPKDIGSNEELYLTGRRIEQFHHATLQPEPYWEEALRRDPGDSRVHVALGIRRLKEARFTEAETHFRKALDRLTAQHTSPAEGDAFYYLGFSLRAQDKLDEAFAAFRKASWSFAWSAAADYAAAEIACHRGDLPMALALVECSLAVNASNGSAWYLKAAVLRHLERSHEAAVALEHADRIDPLDVRGLAERWLGKGDRQAAVAMVAAMERHPANALEVAAAYWTAGLWRDGDAVLGHLASAAREPERLSPLVHYYRAAFATRLGELAQAGEFLRAAAAAPPDYVFPFQWELIGILREAMSAAPGDSRAPYYLGNLLFDGQPEEATRQWQHSAALDPAFPIVHRNLAIAAAHRPGPDSLALAIAHLERAVALSPPYPRHLTELDELYEAAGTAPAARLALLERHAEAVERRDDALGRLVALQVFAGKTDEAITRMTGRPFAVWEGGTLSVAESWTDAHLLRGHQRRVAGRFAEALADYEAAEVVPDNLPTESRGSGDRLPELAWWRGVALSLSGQHDAATNAWKEAAGVSRPRGEQRYYRALAQRKTGQSERAESAFRELSKAADSMPSDPGADFFASFGERQSERSRLAAAHYQAGLGFLGLEEKDRARQEFERALRFAPDHLGAQRMIAGSE